MWALAEDIQIFSLCSDLEAQALSAMHCLQTRSADEPRHGRLLLSIQRINVMGDV